MLLLGFVVLVGCGTPVGTPTGVSRAGMAASPTVARPGPGTPVGTPGTPLAGATQAAVGTPSVPMTPTAGATRTPVANPALPAILREAQSLTISQGAWVYGPIMDTRTSFELRRTGDGFSGTGSYSVTSYYGPKSATTRSLAIPEAAFLAFVERLANAPLREGPYDLGTKMTDYYPEVRIVLETLTSTVVFYSESQKENYVPWKVTYGGKSYVSDSAEPTFALRGLDPYFQRSETLQSLKAAVEATRVAIPTATRVTPLQCRAPVAGQPTPTPIVVPGPDPAAARVAPGSQPHLGEVISLEQYFGVAGASFLDTTGKDVFISVNDSQRIRAFAAALDHEATVIASPFGTPPADAVTVGFYMGRDHTPVGFWYSAQLGLIGFSVKSQSYAVAASSEFRALAADMICKGR